jgi:hypothetical protein
MRVVVDTNVFVSAALKEHSPPCTAAHLVAASHLLRKSAITEEELFVTLERPRISPLIPPRFRNRLNEVLAAAELVGITERIAACRDPKHEKFLEARGQRPCRSDRDRGRRSAGAQSIPGNSDRSSRRRCSCKAPRGEVPLW